MHRVYSTGSALVFGVWCFGKILVFHNALMLYFPLWLVFPVFVFGKAMQILTIFLCFETLVLHALAIFFIRTIL